MKHLVIGVMLMGILLAGMEPVQAAVGYTDTGKVAASAGYLNESASDFDLVDAGAVGVMLSNVAIYQYNPALAFSVLPVEFIVWGAYRTARLRPQAVKDEIHQAMAVKAKLAQAGTVAELLGD